MSRKKTMTEYEYIKIVSVLLIVVGFGFEFHGFIQPEFKSSAKSLLIGMALHITACSYILFYSFQYCSATIF